jgi:hypothetical protein
VHLPARATQAAVAVLEQRTATAEVRKQSEDDFFKNTLEGVIFSTYARNAKIAGNYVEFERKSVRMGLLKVIQ